jgi:hypothetical protein
VHDALGVRGAQRGQDPDSHPGGLGRRQRAVLPHDVAQRRVRHQLHDDPRAIVFLDNVVDPHHVRVIETGRHLGFPEHPAGGLPLGVVQVRRPDQLLRRHVAAQQFVPGTPDGAHPAAADDSADPVPAGQQPV